VIEEDDPFRDEIDVLHYDEKRIKEGIIDAQEREDRFNSTLKNQFETSELMRKSMNDEDEE